MAFEAAGVEELCCCRYIRAVKASLRIGGRFGKFFIFRGGKL